jgi:homoserine O-acetyltransferase
VGLVARLQPVARPGRIQATLLAINSADDERNPPELGSCGREIKRVKNGRVLLIPRATDGRPRHHGPGAVLEAGTAELLKNAPRMSK